MTGVATLARRRIGDQRGFTLIEMLVVLTILGILGCIVAVSMIGLTGLARQRAEAQELMTVQSAMNFMMMKDQIRPEDACAGPKAPGTQDMAEFPRDPSMPDKLWPNYLRAPTTQRAYTCVKGGTVQPAS